MSAALVNLEVEAGATFRHSLVWFNPDGVTPINLTGCTARSHWREAVEAVDVLLPLTTENSRLVIDPLLGKITIRLTALETEAITFAAAVYDLEIVFPADESGEVVVHRLAKGKVKISRECTR